LGATGAIILATRSEIAFHLDLSRFAPAPFSFHGETMTTQKATFGAGWFWGVEATFRATRGVTNATAGYAGGTTENPTYEDVCAHDTGHAEVVQVEFDPAIVSYSQLLDVFWSNHNPTTLNRQGPDVGDQYRSVIFYHTPEQGAAEESKAILTRAAVFSGQS
jgi:peptide-methionine (S)-S-oxide reductase